MENKKKLLVSFSGGRTSAYMLWWIFNKWQSQSNYDIYVVFANTGKEDEKTLEFVNKCEYEWDIHIEWIEYRSASAKGYSVNPKITGFKTASRNGEPFEELISIKGIPTTNAPFCSTILKQRTIRAYARQLGWKPKDYITAIGIRIDEIDRMNPEFRKERIWYPLISDVPTTKKQVNDFWDSQSFNLECHPDLGNCDCCWKKDLKRLVRIVKEHPEKTYWWKDMSKKYGHFNPRNTNLKPPFNFYRGNMNLYDIEALSASPVHIIEQKAQQNQLNGCGESCEAF